MVVSVGLLFCVGCCCVGVGSVIVIAACSYVMLLILILLGVFSAANGSSVRGIQSEEIHSEYCDGVVLTNSCEFSLGVGVFLIWSCSGVTKYF